MNVANSRTYSSNYAFKPTAGEITRFNQPLWVDGGITRRYILGI